MSEASQTTIMEENMGLTVREKEHLKARIDVRIRNRINELIANNEPDFQK
jgi:hypothetical protein